MCPYIYALSSVFFVSFVSIGGYHCVHNYKFHLHININTNVSLYFPPERYFFSIVWEHRGISLCPKI